MNAPSPASTGTQADAPPSSGAQDPDDGRSAIGTRLVVVLSFLVVAIGLCLRNPRLFTSRLYEYGDAAANSLLVTDARSLDLLVGHYSRVGFNHPGPGVLYVQAAGEAVFADLLGLVPGPFNGQVLALLLLQAAVVAAVVGIVHTWSRRWPVAVVTLAGCALWFEAHPYSITSTWMPNVVVAPFLLLLVSAASVAAGRSAHLWLLAASAGLLVHAHVEFALFGPALTVAALLAWTVTDRLSPRALWRQDPRAWLIALGVVGVFVLPIALNTLVNWPGEVPKYLGYSGGQDRPEPTLLEALHYARQFWTPDSPVAKYVPAVLTVVAAALAWTAPRGLRRPLVALTAAAVLAEALFVVYALVGIDDLGQDYIGLFSSSIPLALLLVVATAGVHRLAASRRVGAGLASVAGVLVAVALSGDGTVLRPDDLPDLPTTIDAVEQTAGDRPVVLDIGPGIAPFIDGTALLVHFEREGTSVCADNPALSIQVTVERLCTPQQRELGQVFELEERGTVEPSDLPGQLSEITPVER